MVNNPAIVSIHQNFLKAVSLSLRAIGHVIIIDQWNQTAHLYEIQVTVIFRRVILVAVKSVPCKEGYL